MFKKSDSTLKDNQKNQRIQVFARTRPLSILEIKQHSRSVLEVCSEKKEIRVRDGKMMNKAFAFDRVFGPETTQLSVYQAVVGPLIQEVLMGYNCTVFAYGQTSTGKTFTMEGERSDKTCTWDEDPKAGIIPRSLHQLFEELYKEESVEFSVHVSFLELYNEELFDLLSPNEVQIAKLRLFEDSARKGSVVIQGLEEIKVNSKDEVYTILERGTVRRQTAATHLNASSSRSHTVFSVTVHIKENTIDGEELLKTGKLNLVDLAGSENIGRSGASQKTAREAGNINQSLLTLGRVITALVEKAPHVPYRESKLTRLLQDSLGGHTKTSIIATVSPASCNTEETISTLDYAQRAKSITIKPEVNQKMTKKALIKEYTEEIERLRKDLVATRDNNLGVFIHRDNYRGMEELKETNENLTTKNKEILEGLAETQNILEDTKTQLDNTTNKYNESQAECEKLENKLSKTLQKLKDTQGSLEQTIAQRDEKQYIINVQCGTELKLTEQAQKLLEVASESTKNVSILHDTVDRKNTVNKTNDELSQQFQAIFKNKLSTMNEIISEIAQEQSSNLNSLEVDITGILNSCQKYYSNFRNSFIEDFDMEFQKQMGSTTKIFLSNVESHMSFCDDNAKKVSELMFQNKQLSDGLKLLIEKHSSMKGGWISLVSNLTQFLLEFRKQTKVKLQQLEQQIKSSSATHKELACDLAEMFKAFSSKQLEHSQWCDNQISSLVAQKHNYNKKMEEKFQVIFNALTSIQNFKEEENQYLTSTIAEFHDTQSHNTRNINMTCLDSDRKVESYYEEEDIRSKGSVAVLRDLYMTYDNQEIEVQKRCESTLSEQANVDEEMTAIFQSNENVLNTQEHGLKYVEEHTTTGKNDLIENKSNYLQQVEGSKNIASDKISDIKLHIKVQEECLVPRFNSQLDLVSSTRKRVLESTDTLKSEFLNCGMQVKRFIEDELQKDISTGNTPKRKCFVISDELAATSPHEIILERHRLELDLDETSATKNRPWDSSSDDSPQLKQRTNSKDTLMAPENYSSSDESTAFYSDTYSSQSDLTSESSKNKENQHSPMKKSKIPKKRTPRKGIKSQTIRKPLSSSNVAIQD